MFSNSNQPEPVPCGAQGQCSSPAMFIHQSVPFNGTGLDPVEILSQWGLYPIKLSLGEEIKELVADHLDGIAEISTFKHQVDQNDQLLDYSHRYVPPPQEINSPLQSSFCSSPSGSAVFSELGSESVTSSCSSHNASFTSNVDVSSQHSDGLSDFHGSRNMNSITGVICDEPESMNKNTPGGDADNHGQTPPQPRQRRPSRRRSDGAILCFNHLYPRTFSSVSNRNRHVRLDCVGDAKPLGRAEQRVYWHHQSQGRRMIDCTDAHCHRRGVQGFRRPSQMSEHLRKCHGWPPRPRGASIAASPSHARP